MLYVDVCRVYRLFHRRVCTRISFRWTGLRTYIDRSSGRDGSELGGLLLETLSSSTVFCRSHER